MKYIQYLMILSIIISGTYLIYSQNNNTENFSLSMVDDIIHNKYEKNTEEYYIFRNKRDEEKLIQEPYNLLLYDNLAVGYDYLGELDKALELYKAKKILLDSKELDIDNLYRYHANIGTFYIHDGIKKWFKNSNNIDAQNIIIDGKNHIKKAIELNKEAHFGRESYQLIAIENLISSFNNPKQLIDYNLLGKNTLNKDKLINLGNYNSCGEEYYDIYPDVKKVGKSNKEQILDSCPMALKGIIGMIRFGGGPNPYSFVTIGDILMNMGEYDLAAASYYRALELNHPNSKNIKVYIEKIGNIIYPDLTYKESFKLIENQFKSDYLLGTTWSNNYEKYQKKIISENKNPTDLNIYNDFYKKYNYPQNIKYSRN